MVPSSRVRWKRWFWVPPNNSWQATTAPEAKETVSAERAIHNLRGGDRTRGAGLLDGFWEPEEQAKRDYATSTQPTPSAGDVETSAGRAEQPADRRQRPVGPRAAQSSNGLQPQQQGTRTRALRKRKAETVEEGVVLVTERLNADALADLASRRRAATWRPGKKGQGPTLRQIVADILSQNRVPSRMLNPLDKLG